MSPGRRTFTRYLLFQLPEWLLVAFLLLAIGHYTDAPAWLLAAGGLGFVAKDLLLFPFMRRAYEHVADDPGEDLVGRQARVVEAVAPEGWVRVDAELWRAETGGAPLAVGASVRIQALRGHVLVVEADS